jgi:hypothetical protein
MGLHSVCLCLCGGGGVWFGVGPCPTPCCGVVREWCHLVILSARVISHAATVYLTPHGAVTVCIWIGGCVAWRALGGRPSRARACPSFIAHHA